MIDSNATAVASTPAPVTGSAWCGMRPLAPAKYEHVIWVWMENKDTNAVLDRRAAPFLGRLAGECGAAADYVDRGVHPSLPNYIAATSGSTAGINDDAPPARHPLDADNIFRQVRATGRSPKSYEEAMPQPCALQSAGRYAVKHNPAAYFTGADDRAACGRDDVPFTAFAEDLAAGAVPAFAMVTPDICNDMHDCSVATGDAWLSAFVSEVANSPTYRQGSTVVCIVFDESTGGGTMPFFVVAPSVAPGTVATEQLDHGSLLRFTEDALGIADHLGAAADAADMRAAFNI